MTTRVEIVAEQLPEQLRPLLAAFHEAQRAAGAALNDHRSAPVAGKHHTQAPLDEANAKASTAHLALLEGTRERPTQMREHNHARFAAAVERAREHLQAAEVELRAAAGHAAVHAAVRDGKPTVNFERGLESPGRRAVMFSIGAVQDAAGSLPDGIE